MQVTLLGNNENMVGPYNESLRDQDDRHCRVLGQYFVKQGCEFSDVIDDNKSSAHIARKAPQKPNISVQSAS